MATIYTCLLDERPSTAFQAELLAKTLIGMAQVSGENIFVHHLPDVREEALRKLERIGVQLRQVSPFDARHTFSNKFTQFETPAVIDAEQVVMCDCDLVFAGPIDSVAAGESVRGKLVDVYGHNLIWDRLFESAGLFPRPLSAEATASKEPTDSNYCNGGLYVIPKAKFAWLKERWPRWALWLLEQTWLGWTSHFADQLAFALSMAEENDQVDLLGNEFNCPTTLGTDIGNLSAPPSVLHHHNRLSEGRLIETRHMLIDESIRKVNQFIANA